MGEHTDALEPTDGGTEESDPDPAVVSAAAVARRKRVLPSSNRGHDCHRLAVAAPDHELLRDREQALCIFGALVDGVGERGNRSSRRRARARVGAPSPALPAVNTTERSTLRATGPQLVRTGTPAARVR